jgi:hypothetical protein
MKAFRFAPAAGALALVGSLALMACGTDSPGDPTIVILKPAAADTVPGPNVFIQLKASNNNWDHIHVWLDTLDTTDASTITIISCCQDTTTIRLPTDTAGRWATGAHYIRVQGARANHSDIEGSAARVDFHVR